VLTADKRAGPSTPAVHTTAVATLITLAYRDGNRYWLVMGSGFAASRWLEAYERFLEVAPGADVLWELPEGGLRTLSADDVRDVACRISAIRRRQSGGRFAIASPADVDYGMARMLATYGELQADPPAPIEVFRDADEAWRWLSDANVPVGCKR
jgi:hypothetical protein